MRLCRIVAQGLGLGALLGTAAALPAGFAGPVQRRQCAANTYQCSPESIWYCDGGSFVKVGTCNANEHCSISSVDGQPFCT